MNFGTFEVVSRFPLLEEVDCRLLRKFGAEEAYRMSPHVLFVCVPALRVTMTGHM